VSNSFDIVGEQVKAQWCESKDRTIGGIAGSLSTFRFPELGALGVVDI